MRVVDPILMIKLVLHPGFYIFIDASGKPAGATATLISDSMTGDKCISWWFHMYGSSVEDLNIYKITGGTTRTLEWKRRGNQGTDWMYGQVYMTGSYSVSRLSCLPFILIKKIPAHV